MDQHMIKLNEIKIEKATKALESNNYNVKVVDTLLDAKAYVQSLLVDHKKVALGGSMTLEAMNIVEMCRNSDIDFIDRYNPSLTDEERYETLRSGLLSDLFITSSNAISLDGNLYNIDGTGNRVAAMIFGPKEVLVVVGVNKLFETEDEAIAHIQNVSAPANAIRLNRKTPCAKTGKCMHCQSIDRICRSYVKLEAQKTKRITVLIVKEILGY